MNLTYSDHVMLYKLVKPKGTTDVVMQAEDGNSFVVRVSEHKETKVIEVSLYGPLPKTSIEDFLKWAIVNFNKDNQALSVLENAMGWGCDDDDHDHDDDHHDDDDGLPF